MLVLVHNTEGARFVLLFLQDGQGSLSGSQFGQINSVRVLPTFL